MPKITPQKWQILDKFLKFIGCEFSRQKGSHMAYRRSDLKRPIILPKHKSVKIYWIVKTLKQLGISHDEYLDILKQT